MTQHQHVFRSYFGESSSNQGNRIDRLTILNHVGTVPELSNTRGWYLRLCITGADICSIIKGDKKVIPQ